ncbi:hypothetical protein QQF64_017100 [Cirrhinus molitorella]|uniref:Uncharacterized protein n=1 Tax=Cirrhinus molitorella TaxID=172907 RepID=A0ABR3LHN3_9TELE
MFSSGATEKWPIGGGSVAGHAGKTDSNVMTLRTHETRGLTLLTFCGGVFDDCGHNDASLRCYSPHKTKDTHSDTFRTFFS